MAFPPEFLDEIRARVPLAGVIQRRVRLVKKGREWSGLCPFHNEKSPSFTVNEDKGFYHCLAADTMVLTDAGHKPIAELAGKSATILTRGGVWRSAEFRSYGHQQLYRINLSRNGVKKTLHATSGHRWFVRGRTTVALTTDLKPGHRLDAVLPRRRGDWEMDSAGIRHGIVFGDGTVQRVKSAGYGTVNLHGEKAEDLAIWFAGYAPSAHTRAEGGEYLRAYGGRDFEHMKALPGQDASDAYLLGFLAGYLATDGHVAKDGTVMLHSIEASVLEWVRETADRLGIATFSITKQDRTGYLDRPEPIFRIHFVNTTLAPDVFLRREARERFSHSSKRFERLRWVVEAVTETGRIEEVYCADVPLEHAFALEDNILTGNCFGCGAHGDVFGFVMQSENRSFVEAIESLAGEAGLEVPKPTPEAREQAIRQATLHDVMEAAALFYQAQLKAHAGSAAREYLQRRGLDEAAFERFRLGYASGGQGLLKQHLIKDFPEPLLREAGLVAQREEDRPSFDYFRDRVMFPILDRSGKVIAFGGRVMGDAKPKYLNSPDTPIFHKGSVLYGLSWARQGVGKGAEVIVTEGYMDVIALHRAGFAGAVAPLGTALTESQLEELWRLAPEPILCFDGDGAGQRAAGRALERALPMLKSGRSLRFAVLPAGEDPDTLIGKYGADGMQTILGQARPLGEFLWATELAKRPVDTPERKADLSTRLMARTAEVHDETLKRQYQSFFRDCLYERLRPARPVRGRNAGGGRTRFAKPVAQIPPPPNPLATGRRRRQEALVAVILLHPELLDELIEDFVGVELQAADLDRLRREIINVHNSNPGLDAAALKYHLSNLGFVSDVTLLLGLPVLGHARFALSSDRDVVVAGWRQVLGFLRDEMVVGEEHEAMKRRAAQDFEGIAGHTQAALIETAQRRLAEAELDGPDPARRMPRFDDNE